MNEFQRERQRQEYIKELKKETQEYAKLRASSPEHDDAVANEPLQRILYLEAQLSDEPYVLSEVKFEDNSPLAKEAQQIWESAGPLVSQLQALSLRGQHDTQEYIEISNRLEELGVRFACLFTDAQNAGIIVGNEGWVHQQIRQRAIELREEGNEIPDRPDVSGQIIKVGDQFLLRVDSVLPIMTTHLGVEFRGFPRVFAQIVDSDLNPLGRAELFGPNFRPLSARETLHMTQLQKITRSKRR